MFDVIVVGAGFAGSVIAERLATQKQQSVLLIEKEKHIGGHCYDYRNEYGILVHKYGPHLFHTDSQQVWKYLSQFTEWEVYQHHVLALIDGQKVPLPFSFMTIEKLFPHDFARHLEEKLLKVYQFNQKVPVFELLKQGDSDIKALAEYVYEKVFKFYTMKQWELAPDQIDEAVSARVPIFIGYDTRYFTDTYQAVPKQGYTRLFEKLLDHPKIKLFLGLNFLEIAEIKSNTIYIDGRQFKGNIYYTGMVDELFDFCEGELPYRSLSLHFENIPKEQYQEATTINYPGNYDFTRITEFKHIHPSESKMTTILKEYPLKYERYINRPYYPIFNAESKRQYDKYVENAKGIKNLQLVGRLAEYKYYDMDDIVARALTCAE